MAHQQPTLSTVWTQPSHDPPEECVPQKGGARTCLTTAVCNHQGHTNVSDMHPSIVKATRNKEWSDLTTAVLELADAGDDEHVVYQCKGCQTFQEAAAFVRDNGHMRGILSLRLAGARTRSVSQDHNHFVALRISKDVSHLLDSMGGTIKIVNEEFCTDPCDLKIPVPIAAYMLECTVGQPPRVEAEEAEKEVIDLC